MNINFEKHKNSIYIALLFLLMMLSTNTYATNDKVLHFGVSSIKGYVAESMVHQQFKTDKQRVIYGALLGTLPGLFKEMKDSNEVNNEFSSGDMLANIAGAFSGALLANRVNRHIFTSFNKQGEAYFLMVVYRD